MRPGSPGLPAMPEDSLAISSLSPQTMLLPTYACRHILENLRLGEWDCILTTKPKNPPTNPSRTGRTMCHLRGETGAQGGDICTRVVEALRGGAETEPHPSDTHSLCLVRSQPATLALAPLATPEMPTAAIPNPTQASRPSSTITSSLKPSLIGPDKSHLSRSSHRIPALELDGTQREYPC